MALRPYSVSPLFFDHTVGPNPIMYLVTRTLKSLAGSRCPTSCRAMDTAMPIATKTTPRIKRTTGLMLGFASSWARVGYFLGTSNGQTFKGPRPCPLFSIQHGFDRQPGGS